MESYAMVVPVNQVSTSASSQAFTLNWIAPPLGTVNNYLLDVATDAAFVNPLSGYNAYDAGLSLSKQLTGLTNNTTYYYRLRVNKTSVDGQGAC